MTRFALRRLWDLPPTILVASVLIFVLIHLAPGDPIENALGPLATAETVRAMRAQYGLDQPLPAQYLRWIGRALRGDLGQSLLTREPVTDLLGARLLPTATLTVASALVFLGVSFPAGVLTAARSGSAMDAAVKILVTIGVGLPSFFLAVLLIATFGLRLRWLPLAGFVSPLTDPLACLWHLILPVITLTTFYVALTTRLVRQSVLAALAEDYVRTARGKGLAERVVMIRHAAANGLIPATTAAAINVAYLLGGSVVVEEIFAIPGLGRLLFTAVVNRDFPVIQGITLLSSLVFLASSFIADLVVGIMDPRVRLE